MLLLFPGIPWFTDFESSLVQAMSVRYMGSYSTCLGTVKGQASEDDSGSSFSAKNRVTWRVFKFSLNDSSRDSRLSML